MTPSEQKSALDKIEAAFGAEGQSFQFTLEALSLIPKLREAVQEWQPIDTCPVDTCVLMFCPDTGLTNDERIESGIYHCTRGGYRHAWATHWMSLPKPPKEGE